ncbi:MAG: hypothetical protein ACI8ZM_000981 [Crocinitomix sp.]|jgi:hypothetical protein
MNPKLFLLSVLFLTCLGSFGQGLSTYRYLMHDLDSLMENEKFEEAATLYDTLFINYEILILRAEYIRGAEANVMANRSERAYQLLEQVVFNDFSLYTDYETLTTSLYLMPLQGDERWTLILERVQENYRTIVNSSNEKLKSELNIMLSDYYAERSYIDVFTDAYGAESKEVQSLKDSMVYRDSLNQIRVTKFINTNGIVNENEVGRSGVLSLFLVLNISDTTSRIRYLPLVEEAFQEQVIKPRTYARYVDMLLIDRGFHQRYGTQFNLNDSDETFAFLPVQNPETIDERRAEIGLIPIKRYARMLGLKWEY